MGRGDEAQKRLQGYDEIEEMVSGVEIPENLFPAYYQLVAYPIRSAALINRKFLYRDKAIMNSKTYPLVAHKYKEQSHQAYQDIVKETQFYNRELLNGKWNHMMDMAPRRLPVFDDPKIVLALAENRRDKDWSITVEDSRTSLQPDALPRFNSWIRKKHFIDIAINANRDSETLQWNAKPSHDWIKLSDSNGALSGGEAAHKRIWVEIDWENIGSDQILLEGKVFIQTPPQTEEITVIAENRKATKGSISHVESDQLVVIYAENYSQISGSDEQRWEIVHDLGHTGASMESGPVNMVAEVSETVQDTSPSLRYDFATYNEADQAKVIIHALPTHPLTNLYRLRIGVSVDDGPVQILDFTTQGRSEEWKQNVLSNKTTKSISIGKLDPGDHTLKIFMIDPGVVLDFMYIDMGGLDEGVSVLEETRIRE